MKSSLTTLAFCAAAACWAQSSPTAATALQKVPDDRTFLNFSGVCHGNFRNNAFWGSSIGFDRMDCPWDNLIPQRGAPLNAKQLDKLTRRILELKKRGVRFLPIFDYGSGWSTDGIPDQEFEFAGRHYLFIRMPDGKFKSSAFLEQTVDGRPRKVKVAEGTIDGRRMSRRYLPDDQVSEWENFIRQMVTLLRAEPYNIEYFQVWNEAHPSSSFWYGDMDVYMNNVHKPAAKIIRELGGKVVYGGWICGSPVSELVKYMDRHDAWKTIDVMDLHYFPLAGMDYVRKAMDSRGYGHLGLWQTEIGFSANPNYIGNLYPRVLHWALRNKWDWGDKYKLFYFAYSSPNDPKAYGYRRSLMLGNEINLSGRSLETLGALLGGAPLELYEPLQSTPALKAELNELASSLESFKVGRRIVSAAHILPNNHAQIFIDWNGDGDTIHLDYEDPQLRLSYPALDPAGVEKIERISMYGSRIDLTKNLEILPGGGIAVNVPIREPDRREFKYTDMPEAFLPQVFYTVVTLKEK